MGHISYLQLTPEESVAISHVASLTPQLIIALLTQLLPNEESPDRMVKIGMKALWEAVSLYQRGGGLALPMVFN